MENKIPMRRSPIMPWIYLENKRHKKRLNRSSHRYNKVKKLNQLPITERTHRTAITCKSNCTSWLEKLHFNVLQIAKPLSEWKGTLRNFFKSFPEATSWKDVNARLMMPLSKRRKFTNSSSGRVTSGSFGGDLHHQIETSLITTLFPKITTEIPYARSWQ